jgi:sulfate/thiosulfate transport system ATP-binding protein
MSIELDHVSKQFRSGLYALQDVSVHIQEGEMIAILGPSGSGKTTLLRVIAGLERQTSGEIRIRGEVVDHQPPERRNVGFVFQNYALFKHMTVYDNIAFGLRVQKRKEAEISQRVEALLHLTQLIGLEHRFPHQLSGGQAQRVALARALAPEPSVLLLDEPFAAVDSKIRRDLRKWIRRIHDEIGITSVFVTHDQEEALEIADRVLVIRQGTVEQFGTPEEVYNQPASHFVASFVGDNNDLWARIDAGYASIGALRFPVEGAFDQATARVIIRPSDIRVSPARERRGAIGRMVNSTFKGDRYSVELDLGQGVRLRADVPAATMPTLQQAEYASVHVLTYQLFADE